MIAITASSRGNGSFPFCQFDLEERRSGVRGSPRPQEAGPCRHRTALRFRAPDAQLEWGDSRALGALIGPAVAAGPIRICFVAAPHRRWLHASRRLSLRSAVGPCLERRPCRAAPRCAENSARTGALHRHTVRRWVPGRRAISGHDVSDFSLEVRLCRLYSQVTCAFRIASKCALSYSKVAYKRDTLPRRCKR